MTIANAIEIVDANAVDLGPCPIDKAWILEGSPVARIKVLSKARDGTAATIIWDCTAGRFNWFYAMDETVYFLQGSVTLKDSSGSRVVKAGESVFFPKGSSAEWIVDSYIKKVAFCRAPLPGALASARRLAKRTKSWVLREPENPMAVMFGFS
jgi:uncharacterized cupin superfamily protein